MMFEKYTRAVSDEAERASLHKKYVIRNISQIIFFILCLAIIIEDLVFYNDLENNLFLILFGITLLLWLISAIFTVAATINFRSAFKAIVKRKPSDQELPQVTEYRNNVIKTETAIKKRTLWALCFMIVCIAIFICLIICEVVFNSDSQTFGILGYIGIAILFVGVLAYSLAYGFSRVKHDANKNADIATIDTAQGRKTKYDINSDSNLQNFTYLFPDENLRAQITELQKKRGKILTITIITCLAIGLICVLIFLSDLFFDFGLKGYACPFLLLLVFLPAYLVGIPYNGKINTIEKQQIKKMKDDSTYFLNLELYDKYYQFAKVKGKIIPATVVISILTALLLAIFFPSRFWSCMSLILLIAGVCANNYFFKKLRCECLPIEHQIDEVNTSESESQSMRETITEKSDQL